MLRNNLIAVVLLVFFTACGTGVITTHKWNRDADFGKYKTYSFLSVQKLGSSNVLATDENMELIKKAVRYEMDLRGYNAADSADMNIELDVKLNEYSKQGPTSGEGIIIARLVIVMKDAATQEMVWWGGQEGEALRQTNKREKRINRAVSEIMEVYTFQAGDPIRY